MRAAATFLAVWVPLVVAACGGNTDNTQPAATATTYGGYPPPGYPPPGYPPPGYATAPPQPGYPPQPYPPQPAPYPTQPAPYPAPAPAPAPTNGGAMSAPGLLALPCQSDATCGLHHCNTQYSKCAFPCQTAADCVAPNGCTMGVCMPGGSQ